MKRFIQIAAVTAVLPLLFACGSSKKVAETPKSPSQEVLDYALNAPKGVLRGYGSYNDTEEWFAYKMAAAAARSEVAATISTQMESAAKAYKGKYGKESYDNESIKRGDKDNEKRDEGGFDQIAGEILQGAKVVKAAVVKESNGTLTVYACVEVDSDLIAQYAANNNKIKDLISEDEKMTIDFHREEFENALKERFEKYYEQRGR